VGDGSYAWELTHPVPMGTVVMEGAETEGELTPCPLQATQMSLGFAQGGRQRLFTLKHRLTKQTSKPAPSHVTRGPSTDAVHRCTAG
jgi:hypothetical protein